jgi:shikimate kinase
MNLILIGLRGSGKTTVGRLVAQRLGRTFVDLDDVTARALGAATIVQAWRRCGEPAFRAAESRALTEVLAKDGRVVALGGGTPTAAGAAELLRAARDTGRARVLYLSADAGSLRARLAGTDMSSRPSLTGADPLEEIEVVLARRDGLFRTLASAIVDTIGLSEADVAQRILDAAGST